MQAEPSASPVDVSDLGAAQPLRIFQLMALTAGVAATLAAWPLMDRMILDSFGLGGLPREWSPRAVVTFYCWCPFLAIARLAGPRERRRLAARSYGTASVAASSAALGVVLIVSLGEFRRLGVSPLCDWYDPTPDIRGADRSMFLSGYSPIVESLAGSGPAAACAIVGAWSTLALTGVGRRPAGWFDWACLASSAAFVSFVALYPYAALVRNYW